MDHNRELFINNNIIIFIIKDFILNDTVNLLYIRFNLSKLYSNFFKTILIWNNQLPSLQKHLIYIKCLLHRAL